MYTLIATFNTDDDAELIYEGESYCCYAENLRVSFRASTIKECKEHLKTIIVTQGQKASEFVQNLIDEFIQSDALEITYCGNQEINIFITESKCEGQLGFFVEKMENQIKDFKKFWIKENKKNPDQYPLSFPEDDKGQWFEKFLVFLK